MSRSSIRQLCTPCLAAGSAAFCVLLSCPSQAAAFSAVENYRYPPGAAGGGNRYFTGSPEDSYTCKVCHTGGTSSVLDIRGLPLTAYQPNARYEIVLDWPDGLESFAASIEITDLQGRRAGQLILAPDDEIQAPEYCAPAVNEIPAATITLVPPQSELENFGYCSEPGSLPADCRQVIGIPDCGAKRLRFAWRAPNSDAGPLWFAGSSVSSDQNGDTTGDGVTDFSRVMGSESARNPLASTTTAGCTTFRGHRVRSALVWFWIVLGLFLRRRSR